MPITLRSISIGMLAATGLAGCTEHDASAPEPPAVALVQPPSAEIAGEFTVLKTSTDDISISGATDGSSYLAAIQAGSTEIVKPRLITAPSTVGSIYSTKQEGDLPLAAFDGTNYFLIWTDQTNSNVLGRRVSASGVQVGPLVHVTNTADVIVHCGLAFGAGKYIVTFIRNDGMLYRRFVSPAGQPLGPAKAVSAGAAGCRYLNHVATDGTNFLATWWDYNDHATVMARLVRGDGTLGPLRGEQQPRSK